MSTPAHEQRHHRLQEEAGQMLSAALDLAGLTLEDANALSDRTRLQGDTLYENEIFAWQIPSDASVVPLGESDEFKAAALFLDAGRRFTEVADFANAVLCLHCAINYSRRVKGPEAREIEIRAAHGIAYAYLTELELSRDPGKAVALNAAAARYFELEGFLRSREGDIQDSASAYGNARFRYGKAGEFENAARAAHKEQRGFEGASDTERASQAAQMQAEMLFAASEKGTDRRIEALEALLEVGRLLEERKSDKLQAAQSYVQAGEKGLALVRDAPGTLDNEIAGKLLTSLKAAQKIYGEIAEFSKADKTHYLANRIRHERYRASGMHRYLNPAFGLSVLLDLTWGYGERPWRLVPSAFATIVLFAFLNYFIADVHWAATNNSFRPSAAILLSVTSFLPAQLLEKIAKIHVLPGVVVNRTGDIMVLLESLIGLAFIALAGKSISRWFKRRYLATGDE